MTLDSLYLHLLVNHVPIVASVLALPLLAIALLRKDRGVLLATVCVLSFGGLGAWASLVSGERAAHRLEGNTAFSNEQIKTHEERAEKATGLALFAALAGWFTLWAGRRGGEAHIAIRTGLILAALLSAGGMAWAGQAGGKIGHPELRQP